MHYNTLALVAALCALVGFLMTMGRLFSRRRIGLHYERELFLSMLWCTVLILSLILVFAVFK